MLPVLRAVCFAIFGIASAWFVMTALAPEIPVAPPRATVASTGAAPARDTKPPPDPNSAQSPPAQMPPALIEPKQTEALPAATPPSPPAQTPASPLGQSAAAAPPQPMPKASQPAAPQPSEGKEIALAPADPDPSADGEQVSATTNVNAPPAPPRRPVAEAAAPTERVASRRSRGGSSNCMRYRTYNPKSHSYRGYDGRTRACRAR
jgi:hypothetical protein